MCTRMEEKNVQERLMYISSGVLFSRQQRHARADFHFPLLSLSTCAYDGENTRHTTRTVLRTAGCWHQRQGCEGSVVRGTGARVLAAGQRLRGGGVLLSARARGKRSLREARNREDGEPQIATVVERSAFR